MYSILRINTFLLFKLRIEQNVTRNFWRNDTGISRLINSLSVVHSKNFTETEQFRYQQIRYVVSGFFNKHSAEQIWKGVSSVSKAGRKRGRGKIRGKKIIKDLNKGQIIGIGKENIRFPGLSAPILRGRELVQQQTLPPDENYEENLIKARKPMAKLVRQKVAPIDRGWSGGHPGGRKIGPPDPIGEDKFENFESVILEQKPVVHMTRNFGRYRTVACIVATGNGNGLVGYSLATAPEAKAALKRAKNRASQKLMYVQRYENHTIMHNFYARFGNTKITAWKQGIGYGLKCHRILKSLCELIGIKDIYAKVEGGDSTLNIINAFLIGLLRQKSFDELATETHLHVVEMNKSNDYFPKVLASPNDPVESSEETPDFNLYVFDDQVFHWKKKWPPTYTLGKRWPIELRKRENIRSHFDTKIQLLAEYNELKSFLTDRYHECKPCLPPWSRKIKFAKMEHESSSES
ncbi:hypothetical protein PGB90_006377 [Kerria lacca]